MRMLKCGCDGAVLKYADKYDACYCSVCGEWVDNKCADPECEFCSTRQVKPLKEWSNTEEGER